MITSIFAFDDMLAYEVMTPRTDVFCIDINAPTEDYIDEMMELRYSRIPVYEDDSDNIIGILYIKDYLIKAKEAGLKTWIPRHSAETVLRAGDQEHRLLVCGAENDQAAYRYPDR